MSIYTAYMQALFDSVTEGMSVLVGLSNQCLRSDEFNLPQELLPRSEILQKTMLDVVNFLRSERNGKDLVYDEEILSHCKQAEVGCRGIVQSISQILEKGKDKYYFQLLDEACSDTMKGCIAMLDAYDRRERRAIETACKETKETVSNLSRTTDLKAFFQALEALNVRLMLCLKLSGERANLLEKGSYRSAFESAISELKKNSIGLVQTVKTYADQFDNPAGTVMRDFYIQEIQLACEEISRLVNLRIILDDSLFPPGDLSLSLACVKEALQAGKMGAYVDEEIKKQLSSNFDKLIEEGQRILENCDNLESLEKTQKLISESKKEVKKVEELACKLQENPEDKTAELAYGVACEELLENIFRLDEDYKNTLTSQRERYALSLSESSHLIMDAAAAGDSKGVETIATQFYKDAEVLDKVAKTVASVTEDGLKSAAVLQAAANLSKYHPVFLAAYKLCPRTGNAADLQRAAQTQEEWLHRYDELLIAMDRATPTFAGSIAVAEELFYKAADQTQAACEKGDQQGFLRAKQKVQFIEGRLQSLLERELTASGGLETKTGSSESDLKKALDQVAAISLSSMDNFIAVYSGIKVEGLLRPAKAVIRLKDAGEAKKMEAPSEGGDQQTRIVREDKVIIFEQMKRLRTADNIIGKAAQGLHQAVSRWDDHENDLISTMKKISENFARLSILKDEVLKKTELIEVSRFIVEDARKAASMASELAKHCVDKRLAQDLQTRVIQADTLSTQLKILSTVKASIPDDQQADQQLSVSAQNLMNVCKGLLSEAHSCAIKCPQSSALIQKWRTVEYKFQ